MKEPSRARKRTLALQERAIRFSTGVNQSYPTGPVDYSSEQAKESKACLRKIHLGPLHNATRVAALGLEQEADELCAIFATIITNVEKRLDRGRKR